MRIEIRNDLLIVCILTLVLILLILFFPPNLLRQLLGLLFVLFLNGYAFVAAIFPQKGRASLFEWFALSFGISVMLGSLIGFLLNYTQTGLTLYSLLLTESTLVLALSVTAWYRRLQLPEEKRFSLTFTLPSELWPRNGVLDKALSLALAFTIAVAFGVLGFSILHPVIGEKFTELYIIGPEGKAADYPQELSVGEQEKVTVGIVNHEQEEESYIIEIRLDGVRCGSALEINRLGPGERWEQEVFLVPEKVGRDLKAEFVLYRRGEDQPYRVLYLWVNVSAQ